MSAADRKTYVQLAGLAVVVLLVRLSQMVGA